MMLADRLRQALGPDVVFEGAADVIMYEYDYGLDRAMPDLVALPRSTADVQVLVREAHALKVPIVARGAGTGISGGAVPSQGGLVISLARMNRVLEIDAHNRCAVVQPGVVNLDLSKIAEPYGLFFAPDPSSQKASTIGGNIANNAGGPHCLSLGVTVNHILGVQVVLFDGTVVCVGGKSLRRPRPRSDRFDGRLGRHAGRGDRGDRAAARRCPRRCGRRWLSSRRSRQPARPFRA